MTIRYRKITVDFLQQDRTYEVRFQTIDYLGLLDLFLTLSKVSFLPMWHLQYEFNGAKTVQLETAALVCGWNFRAYVDSADQEDLLPGSGLDDSAHAWIYWYNEDSWTHLVIDKNDIDRVIGGALRWLERMDEVDDRMRARRQHQD